MEGKKKEVRISMLNCSNATRDLNCCSVSCFADLQKRRGAFAQYPEHVNIRLVGVISCAGCPTRAYPEKILKRVDSVMQFRTEYLHISNWMMAFCPFVNKYIEVIQKHYPDVKIVKGTHSEHVTQEAFRKSMVTAFERGKGMPDIILGRENE
ncbi:MAG: CGGC domain-containing protein [Bilifractor sp.]